MICAVENIQKSIYCLLNRFPSDRIRSGSIAIIPVVVLLLEKIVFRFHDRVVPYLNSPSPQSAIMVIVVSILITPILTVVDYLLRH